MGYLGKISAIVSANTSDFSSKLAASGKEVQSWARALNSAVNSASSKASSSLRGIYTEAQKTERALQAIQARKINFKGFEGQNLAAAVSRMQALVSATKEVNEPLSRAARSIEKLPVAMQGGFVEAMKRAQAQAERLAVEIDKIGSGTLVSNSALERKFEAIAARAMMTAQAVDRLKEVAGAVGSLATGTEVRFRNPEFASEMARARGLQEQAAAAPGGDFSAIIQRQAAAANDLATAFARMEESRLTANGDVAGATAAYEKQLSVVQQIGNELEQAITASRAGAEAERERAANMRRSAEVASTLLNVLQQESALLSNQGAATDVRGRLQAAQAVQRAAQEEAAYRERAAEQAEREAAALAQVVAQQNRAFLIEQDRRSGTLARNNSAAFDAATEGVMRTPANSGVNIFGPPARTVETELDRTRAMYQEFVSLSPEVQASLESQRQSLNKVAAGARDGSVSLGVLVDANDRWAASVRVAVETAEQAAAAERERAENMRRSAEVASTLLNVLQQESALLSSQGAATDASGRLQAAQAAQRAAQENAAYRERAAEQAEREAAALAQVVAQQNRAFLIEQDRRSGVLARNNSAAFDSATDEVMRSPAAAKGNVFGPAERTVETELNRTRAMYQEFIALSPEIQASLQAEAQALNNIAKGARDGAVSLGVLIDANDRFAASARAASEFVSSDDLAKQAAATREDVLRRLQNSGSFVSSDDLIKSARGMDRGAFQPLEDLDAAAKRLRAEQDQIRSFTAKANFGGTVGDAFETAKINKAKAEIAALQGILIKIGVTTGAAAEAVDDLAAAWQRATSEVGGTVRWARQLKEVADEAAEAVQAAVNGAASGGPGPGPGPGGGGSGGPKPPKIDVKQVLARAGDVGRFGADKFTLGVQQAIFAVDDFFSVTGDFQQRMRAVGNNLTQLGFIVGGTEGLFAALAASLALQGAGALYKWMRAGVGAEDQTKAMNDALARQKSLVEELTQAFDSLQDAIARQSLSAPAQSAREFAKQVEDVRKKQKDVRDERIFALDPAVQRERGIQGARQRELEKTEDPGIRLRLQREIIESRRREEEAKRSAAGRVVTPGDIVRELTSSIREMGVARAQAAASSMEEPAAAAAAYARGVREADRRASEFEASAPGDIFALKDILERQIDELTPMARGGFFTNQENVEASRQLARLTKLLEQLESPLRAAVDDLAIQIIKSSRSSAVAIEQAQNEVAEAIRAGIPSAITFRADLDRLGEQLDKAYADLRDIREKNAKGEVDTEEAKRRTDEVNRRIDAVQSRRASVLARSDSLRFERTVDSQRGIDARTSRAEANLNEAGLASGQLARRLREIEFRRETIRQELDRANPQDTLTLSLLQRSQEALNAEAAAIEAATMAVKRFTDALDRAAQEAQSNFQSAQRRADEARAADLGRPTRASAANRAKAERDVAEQREANNRVQDEVAKERARLEEQAMRPQFDRIREINEQLAAGNLSADQQAVLIDERRQLQNQIDQAVAESPAVQAARDDSTRIEQRQSAEDRGRELALTPAMRAAREINQGVDDINKFFDATGGPGRQDAIKRFREEQMRQAAPAVFSMMDDVRNAVLQGPSRAALTASDASSVEGRRELNRLLRGDDAAKDANLVELSKQTSVLEEIARNTAQGAPVANI